VLANGGGYYPAFVYVEEARRLGLDVRLPDINRSAATWSAETDEPGAPLSEARAIRAGLGQIAEIEGATVERILAEREARGAFLSLADLCARAAPGVAELHRLIDAGCFDAFDLTRPQAKWKAELLLRGGERAAGGPAGNGAPSGAESSGGRLFGRAAWHELEAAKTPVPPLPDYAIAERRRREWDLLGVSPRHHPIEFWHDEVAAVRRARAPRGERAAPILAREIARHAGRRVTMVGVLAATKRVRTKHGEPMMFLTLEDETDLYDVVLFPRVYQRDGGRIGGGPGPFVVTGRVEDDPHPSTVTAERLTPLSDMARGAPADVAR
jgi:DNA polymerase III alpha subunit